MKDLSDEERLEQMLEGEYKAGLIPLAARLQILEQFRAAKAQRHAATYALWSAVGTVACAFLAAISVAVSLLAHH
jgi:hypothetical protein